MMTGLTLLIAVAAPAAATAPSYSCAGALTPTEAVICGDGELSALDRAMAKARQHGKRAADQWNSQKAWLAERDACGVRRDCIREAYSGWFGEFGTVGVAPELVRITKATAGVGDLMLGTMQSPTGEVAVKSDNAGLEIWPVGGEYYYFALSTVHVYDPHDGRGDNASVGGASGVVRIRNNQGKFAQDSCALTFKRAGARWIVSEAAEEGSCGGVGTTLGGVYAPAKRKR